MRTQNLEKLTASHNQTLLARSAKVSDLKAHLAFAHKRARYAKHDKNRARARLQQLQIDQRRYHADVFRVLDEIAAMIAGLVKDRNFSVCGLKHNNDQTFSDLVQKLVQG